MAILTKHFNFSQLCYRHRVLTSLIIVLLLCNMVIQLWPVDQRGFIEFLPSTTQEDLAFMESIVITRQSASSIPVASRKPVIPQLEPIIKDVEIPDLADFMHFLDVELNSLPISNFPGPESGLMLNPNRSAVPIRIVEPELETLLPEPLRGKIRIDFTMNVSANGRVESVSIDEFIFFEPVKTSLLTSSIETDLRSASIRAAMQWKFRPAQYDQQNVKSPFRSSFRF